MGQARPAESTRPDFKFRLRCSHLKFRNESTPLTREKRRRVRGDLTNKPVNKFPWHVRGREPDTRSKEKQRGADLFFFFFVQPATFEAGRDSNDALLCKPADPGDRNDVINEERVAGMLSCRINDKREIGAPYRESYSVSHR